MLLSDKSLVKCHDIVVDTVDIENMFILPHEIFTCSYKTHDSESRGQEEAATTE